jgi:oxygen-dependent protoporphyrinogen oxidase
MLTSSLFSLPGKLRMGLDLVLPRGHRPTESIGAFVRRRFGQEAVEKIADPLLGGIYVAPADRLSLRATFPRLADLERDKRSLILALRKIPSRGSPFRTLRGGMSALIEALRDRLEETEILTGTEVTTLERKDGGYRVEFEGGGVRADAVILALPGPRAARLVEPFAPELSRRVGSILHVSTATVSLGYSRTESEHLDANGFVIPRGERKRILACTWSSSKFEGRTEPGGLLVRCFVGGFGREDQVQLPAEELIAMARQELEEMMGLTAKPDATKVFRWHKANPIYGIGHLVRVDGIESALEDIPGLYLAGSAYRGVGIPDCIHEAGRLAERIRKS